MKEDFDPTTFHRINAPSPTLPPLAQHTKTPKLTKSQLELLQTLALPHITHLMKGFRGALLGGARGGEKKASNATAGVLMRTAYLTRHRGRGTSSECHYTISPRGLEYLSAHTTKETK